MVPEVEEGDDEGGEDDEECGIDGVEKGAEGDCVWDEVGGTFGASEEEDEDGKPNMIAFLVA